jgi:hypothetical protein
MKQAVLVSSLGLCLCAFSVQSSNAQDTATRIKIAQYALGMIRGPQRIDAINTMEYWANGSGVTYHVSLSYFTPAMRVDVTHTDTKKRDISVVNGKFAWNESVPGAGFLAGTTAVPAPDAVKDRLLQLWSTPHGALKMAERAGSNANMTTENGTTVITFPLADLLAEVVMKVTLNAKNQVEKVQTRTERGALIETTYSDYKDLGEIKSDVLFPSHLVRKQDGAPTLDLTITKTDCNNPYVVFPVPPNVDKGPSK